MHDGCSDQDDHSRFEKSGHLNGTIEGINSYTQRDADVPITYLRAINNLRISAPGVIKSEQTVGQYHQPPAQPAEVLRADESGMHIGYPIHKPIGAEVNAVGAGGKDGEV